jgi:cytochrome c oxidase subunit 3
MTDSDAKSVGSPPESTPEVDGHGRDTAEFSAESAPGAIDESAAGDGHAEHPPFLAHHYDSPKQQFEAGKLGMWIFLVTEVLLFSGLFVAYAVYRANHPEVFIYAHQFLDRYLGAINTAVLITSSLTMAWAVRAAQLDKQRTLITCLVLTLLGACGFLGIKYVEYKHKWEDGLLWASRYDPKGHAAAGGHGPGDHVTADHGAGDEPGDGAASDSADAADPESSGELKKDIFEPQAGDRGGDPTVTGGYRLGIEAPHGAKPVPRNVGLFFSIYFAMTGLHAVHVLAGMGAIAWVLSRAVKGHFNSQYFGPVDYVGLYWHLVDLVWIYLFPLLYLIH